MINTDISSDKAYDLAQGLTKLLSFLKPKKFVKDIKPIQMMVLMSICFLTKENGYAIPSMISEELGLSKSALSAILNSLEQKKLLTRQLSSEDRRMLLLSLTKDAFKLMDTYHENVKISVMQLADYLGEDDTEKFIELLTKANKYLEKT